MAQIPSPHQIQRTMPYRVQRTVAPPRDYVSPALRERARSLNELSNTLNSIAVNAQRQQEKADAFEAEANWIKFKEGEDATAEGRAPQIAAAGSGAAESEPAAAAGGAPAAPRPKTYDDRARAFLKTVPDHLKQEYDLRLMKYGISLRKRAAAKAKAAAYNATMNTAQTTANSLLLGLVEKPGELANANQTFVNLVEKSGLKPSTKAKLKSNFLRKSIEASTSGYINRKDFDGADASLEAGRQLVMNGGKSEKSAIADDGTTAETIAKNTKHSEDAWIEKARKYNPDATRGKSRADILKMRTDETAVRNIETRHVENLNSILESAGHETTPANAYLANAIGVGPKGGAIAVLEAPDNARAEQVLPKETLERIPYLKGKTIGTIKQWAAQKAGKGSTRKHSALDYRLYMKLRSRVASARAGHRKDVSKAELTNLSMRILEDPHEVTEDQILANKNLTDTDRISAIKNLRTEQKKTQYLRRGQQAIAAGPGTMNARDAEDRKSVDAVHEYRLRERDRAQRGTFVGDGVSYGPAVEIKDDDTIMMDLARETHVASKQTVNTLQSYLHSGDKKEVAKGAALAAEMYRLDRRIFDGRDGSEALAKAGATYDYMTGLGMKPEQVATTLQRLNDPGQRISGSELERMAAANVKEVTAKDITAKVWPTFFSSIRTGVIDSGEAILAPTAEALRRDYVGYHRAFFIESNGNENYAAANAYRMIKERWGASQYADDARGISLVTGPGYPVVRDPIEKAFPAVGGNHDYIGKQALADLKEYTGRKFDRDDIRIYADPAQTATRRRNGLPPLYRLMYKMTDKKSGQEVWNTMPGSFDPEFQKHKDTWMKAQERAHEDAELLDTGIDGVTYGVDSKGRKVLVNSENMEVMKRTGPRKYEPTGEKYTPQTVGPGQPETVIRQPNGMPFDATVREKRKEAREEAIRTQARMKELNKKQQRRRPGAVLAPHEFRGDDGGIARPRR